MNRVMMYHQKKLILLTCLACFGLSGQAQMVNLGDLYVGPDAKVALNTPLQNQGLWVNEGETVLSAGLTNSSTWQDRGRVRLESNQNQVIQGHVPIHYLVLNSPVQVEGELQILHTLHFQQGHIQGPVQFGAHAWHLGMSSESHVVGQVIKLGETPFSFPVGDGLALRSLELAPSASQMMSVQVMTQDPAQLSNQLEKGLSQLDSQQFWLVKSDHPNAEVQIKYDPADAKALATLQQGIWRKSDGKISITTPQGLPLAIGNASSSYMRLGVWPNPSQGEFSLKLEGFKESRDVTVEVVSAEGRRISVYQGLVKDLRGTYQLPHHLVTSQLTIRVLYEDFWWSEKLIYQP